LKNPAIEPGPGVLTAGLTQTRGKDNFDAQIRGGGDKKGVREWGGSTTSFLRENKKKQTTRKRRKRYINS